LGWEPRTVVRYLNPVVCAQHFMIFAQALK
jgi:hypothetical protein